MAQPSQNVADTIRNLAKKLNSILSLNKIKAQTIEQLKSYCKRPYSTESRIEAANVLRVYYRKTKQFKLAILYDKLAYRLGKTTASLGIGYDYDMGFPTFTHKQAMCFWYHQFLMDCWAKPEQHHFLFPRAHPDHGSPLRRSLDGLEKIEHYTLPAENANDEQAVQARRELILESQLMRYEFYVAMIVRFKQNPDWTKKIKFYERRLAELIRKMQPLEGAVARFKDGINYQYGYQVERDLQLASRYYQESTQFDNVTLLMWYKLALSYALQNWPQDKDDIIKKCWDIIAEKSAVGNDTHIAMLQHLAVLKSTRAVQLLSLAYVTLFGMNIEDTQRCEDIVDGFHDFMEVRLAKSLRIEAETKEEAPDDFQQAVLDAKKQLQKLKSPLTAFKQGEQFWQAGDCASAVKEYQLAIELDKQHKMNVTGKSSLALARAAFKGHYLNEPGQPNIQEAYRLCVAVINNDQADPVEQMNSLKLLHEHRLYLKEVSEIIPQLQRWTNHSNQDVRYQATIMLLDFYVATFPKDYQELTKAQIQLFIAYLLKALKAEHSPAKRKEIAEPYLKQLAFIRVEKIEKIENVSGFANILYWLLPWDKAFNTLMAITAANNVHVLAPIKQQGNACLVVAMKCKLLTLQQHRRLLARPGNLPSYSDASETYETVQYNVLVQLDSRRALLYDALQVDGDKVGKGVLGDAESGDEKGTKQEHTEQSAAAQISISTGSTAAAAAEPLRM